MIFKVVAVFWLIAASIEGKATEPVDEEANLGTEVNALGKRATKDYSDRKLRLCMHKCYFEKFLKCWGHSLKQIGGLAEMEIEHDHYQMFPLLQKAEALIKSNNFKGIKNEYTWNPQLSAHPEIKNEYKHELKCISKLENSVANKSKWWIPNAFYGCSSKCQNEIINYGMM